MFTLVIVVMSMSYQPMSVAITALPLAFQTEAACEAAAAQISPDITVVSRFTAKTYCVKTK